MTGVWGLDTGRAGEFRQVELLGQALDLGFAPVRLSPEGRIPETLPVMAPRVILSFGRAAPAALALGNACRPRPLLVHLGTPGHIAVTAFDLIIPMPQDDYPPAENVLFLRMPLNGAGAAAAPAGRACTVIIGGPSRHFRMPRRSIQLLLRFGARLAAANGEKLVVVTSPRTPAPVLAALRAGSGFELSRYGDAPFAEILRNGARFTVTADSASMLSEAWRTGAAVWLFPLPAQPNPSDILQHATDFFGGRRLRHRLIRRGLVGGGTDFRRWHRTLAARGNIAMYEPGLPDETLRWRPAGALDDPDLDHCRTRILGLLKGG